MDAAAGALDAITGEATALAGAALAAMLDETTAEEAAATILLTLLRVFIAAEVAADAGAGAGILEPGVTPTAGAGWDGFATTEAWAPDLGGMGLG